MQPLSLSRLKRRGMIGGALLTAMVGAFFAPWSMGPVTWKAGESLALRSYDFPFLWRAQIDAPEVVIVYLDAKTREQYSPEGGSWERRLYARLLERLIEDQASVVVFDMLFEKPKDPRVDQNLADLMRRHGNVVIGSDLKISLHQTGDGPAGGQRTLQLPLPLFREAARSVGLIVLKQEAVQRHLYQGLPETPTINWVAAKLNRTHLPLPSFEHFGEHWLNFYGPAYSLKSVSLSDAVQPDGIPRDFFRGRTVFVGGHPSLFPGEQFQTPFSREERFGGSTFQQSWSPGVELLATSYLNLVRKEYITRLFWPWQLTLIVLFGGLAGAGLLLCRPWHAAWISLLAAATIAILSMQWQDHQFVSWTWLVPVAIQLPVALLWSVGYQYVVEGRQRRQLLRAFGAYLSPHLVERIAQSDFDVTPGGQEVEATILFTDLEGFTAIAEKLPPREVSRLLIAYFNETTQSIWAHEGTIIKYIGDSVMAAWGAPLPEGRHAERAVLAACGIIEAGKKEILGRHLRTRIGINTGTALAGNLGSKFRFDYTVIGATTNLASRLEGMNQRLGTSILISESTRRQLSEQVRVRRLGRFLVKGITEPFRPFEVLGSEHSADSGFGWLDSFEKAIVALERQEWTESEELFRQTKKMRGGFDGPSDFYLALLGHHRAAAGSGPPDWDGIAILER